MLHPCDSQRRVGVRVVGLALKGRLVIGDRPSEVALPCAHEATIVVHPRVIGPALQYGVVVSARPVEIALPRAQEAAAVVRAHQIGPESHRVVEVGSRSTPRLLYASTNSGWWCSAAS